MCFGVFGPCSAACWVHKIHFHANQWIFYDYFLTVWAVSIVNSSKLTHSLWLISLCLSWILLPVFEALQWADDCLGRDYYTNLSTLLCQALSPGRLCVCVFLGFITLPLRERKCLCACSSMSMHLCTYVYMCLLYTYIRVYACKCVSFITVIFSSHGSLLFPVALTAWLSANIHHRYTTTCR